MWTYKNSIVTTASKKDVWMIISEVEKWKHWFIPIYSSQLRGNFDEQGIIDLNFEDKIQLQLSFDHFTHMDNFTLHSQLKLSEMLLRFELEQEDDMTIVEISVEFKGTSWPFFSYMLGTIFRKRLAKSLENLIELAEKKD
jgi:hypothetical protein